LVAEGDDGLGGRRLPIGAAGGWDAVGEAFDPWADPIASGEAVASGGRRTAADSRERGVAGESAGRRTAAESPEGGVGGKSAERRGSPSDGGGAGLASGTGRSDTSSSGPEGRGAGGRRRVGVRRQVGGRRGRRAGEEPAGPADPAVDGVADPYSVARTILLDKLTGQPRTRAELADVLAEREIPDEVADEVLDRFTDVGLIDDAAFATAWVESRHRGRGLGKRALAQELRRRGVDDQLARDALDELEPDQEEDTARELVRRKLRSMRSLDRQVAMRRLLGMLARKGYPGGLAVTIVKQELDASHEELPLLDSSGIEPD